MDDEISKLLKDMDKLRDNLYMLIQQKGNLQDKEVIWASIMLNAAIAQYNKILESKVKPK